MLRRQRHLRADADQGHVEPALGQLGQQFLAHAHAQVHVHGRMRAAEAGQQRGHVDHAERGDLADADAPAHRAKRQRHFLLQPVGGLQGEPGVAQEHFTGRGGPHLAVAAFEQACAEGVLQPRHLVAQRRLHGMAARGGGGEPALLGDGDDELQLAQGEHAITQKDGKDENNTLASFMGGPQTCVPLFPIEAVMSSQSPQTHVLSQRRVMLLAAATGLIVASNYYAQPLLQLLGDAFGLGAGRVGWVVTVAQLSYAAGLLLIVPLGDRLERRRLIVALFVLAALGLLVSASAGHFTQLLAGTALSGLCAVAAQVIIPHAR